MPNRRIVLDTNCLLASLSRLGSAYPVWKGFQDGRYALCVSTEILEEYEEIIAEKTTPSLAKNVVDLIVKSENVVQVNTYYHWNLITADPDDNTAPLPPEPPTSCRTILTSVSCATSRSPNCWCSD